MTQINVNGKRETEGRCPFREEGRCTMEGCALWNEDVRACALSPYSLHLIVKTAVCDASVEIWKARRDAREARRAGAGVREPVPVTHSGREARKKCKPENR